MNDVFLIDANIFITPYERFYPFDFAPNFWSQFATHISNGNIAILDIVKDEIDKGKDDLAEWLNKISIGRMISHKDANIISNYGQVIQYIQNANFYKPLAIQEWSNAIVADPWLVATAMHGGQTLVTFETPNTGLNSNNKSKRVKLPDVANHFGVKVVDLFFMMRQLNFKL